jgi:capsular polysaccharide biosynthesis protein
MWGLGAQGIGIGAWLIGGRMHKRPLFGAPRIVVRRHRALVALLGILGLCIGIGFGLNGRSQSSAVALVQLPQESGNGIDSPTDEALTQAVVAMSTPVLSPAIKSLSPPVSAPQIKVHVTSPTNPHILRIQAEAPRREQAIQLANAVASEYVQYATRTNIANGQPTVLESASIVNSRFHVMTPIDGIGGLVAGVAIGGVVLWKGRREWRDVQLI